MNATFQPVADGVFRVEDTCSVYLIVRDNAAIAIDVGSGAWLNRLGQLGVERVEWVLLTHTHRDQCAGLYELDRKTTRVAVPAYERHLVAEVETFWRRRRTFHNYNHVGDFFSLPRSVAVDLSLVDYDRFQWRDVELEIYPAPGHTPGSAMFVGDVGGEKIAFVGDLIESPGSAVQIHNLQYAYTDALGAELLSQSIHLLKKCEVALICPGHGEVIKDPDAACNRLLEKVGRFCSEMYHDGELTPDMEFIRVSEHLWESSAASCSWYAIVSDNGRALLIDLGYQASGHGMLFLYDYRPRFFPHRLDSLLARPEIDGIDAILVTHYHDDHIVGIPYAQRRWGLPVWCLDRIAPILREPHRFNMPCLLPEPITVDRTFEDRQRFEWQGIEFQMHNLPGQTDLHSGISFDLDGERYLAMGDSAHFRDDKLLHGHIIFANRVTGANHIDVADRMLEIEPTVLLHGHHRRVIETGPGGAPQGRADTPVTRQDLLDFRDSAESLAGVLEDIVTNDVDRRCRADWVRFDPYRIDGRENGSVEFELVIENVHRRRIKIAVDFVAPEGMASEPDRVTVDLEPKEIHRSSHRLSIGEHRISSPAILCADVILDGRRLGWLAECQIWIDGDWMS
jgi:glyoxylase-like metal-dependent hydrolase (beta-lactamase superfamily II)